MHNIPVLVGLTTENNGHTKVKTTGTQHRNYQMTISTCTWLQEMTISTLRTFPAPSQMELDEFTVHNLPSAL